MPPKAGSISHRKALGSDRRAVGSRRHGLGSAQNVRERPPPEPWRNAPGADRRGLGGRVKRVGWTPLQAGGGNCAAVRFAREGWGGGCRREEPDRRTYAGKSLVRMGNSGHSWVRPPTWISRRAIMRIRTVQSKNECALHYWISHHRFRPNDDFHICASIFPSCFTKSCGEGAMHVLACDAQQRVC